MWDLERNQREIPKVSKGIIEGRKERMENNMREKIMGQCVLAK